MWVEFKDIYLRKFETKAKKTLPVPVEAMDYSQLAFFPDRWINAGVPMKMYAWKGEEVCFLTQTNDLDPALMTAFVGNLDRGYKFYREMVGARPIPIRVWLDKPVIASVPSSRLTCGFACGYVGTTGIEVSNFVNDYKAVKRNPNSMAHYYYYEMGRNYYVFGSRHNAFVTGFAVFMRYCCLENLIIVDNDRRAREAIDKAIDAFEKSDLGFVKAFTPADGLSEKAPRFQRYSGPCDQPVMYASAMLKLRRDYGGDQFVKRFYHAVRQMPEMGAGSRNPQDAHKQCLTWMISASYAAKQDLSELFADRWRLPVSKKLRSIMKEIDWQSVKLSETNPAIDFVKSGQ